MDTCKSTLIKTADTLHLTMSEIQRLSYMLMINTDVQAFIMQNTIAQGSADIQILINAQRQLSYVKSVHPAIDSLYLYSKKSDYLLEADNAFFNIDAMYTALFTFQDLNGGNTIYGLCMSMHGCPNLRWFLREYGEISLYLNKPSLCKILRQMRESL